MRMRAPDGRVLTAVPEQLVAAYRSKGWVEDRRKRNARRGAASTSQEFAGTEPESTTPDESEED